MKILFRFVLAINLAWLASFVSAVPPQTINYQGYLTGPTGTPTNTPVGMTFKLYNAASGGALLYTELQPSVAVNNGNFNALIGAVSPIPLPFDVPYWLTVTINADPEMSPRQPLASSAYAFRAATADSVASVNGSQITGSITTATIPGANVIGAIAGPNDITGNLTMVNSTSTTGNIMKGLNRFIHNFGISNTFIGVNAGNVTLTGNSNTGGGTNALASLANGSRNTALGDTALASNADGSDNTAIGRDSMFANTSGGLNTAIGQAALFSSTGSGNIAIGASAGLNLTNGNNNIAIGNSGVAAESQTIRIGGVSQNRAFIAGVRSVTPAVNDALPVVIDSAGQLGTVASLPAGPVGPAGPQGATGATGATGPAGPNDITGNLTMVNSTPSTGNIMKGSNRFIHNSGNSNTFIGVLAGSFGVSGSLNTGGGSLALANLTAGIANTALGDKALNATTSGSGNTAIGSDALMNSSTTLNNTAVGGAAGRSLTSGGNNTLLGGSAGQALTSGDFNLYLNNVGAAVESNTARIGSAGNQTRAFMAGIRGVTPAVADALPVTVDSQGQLGTGGATNLTLSGALNFSTTTLQKLNLYGVTYGIGVQDSTMYQRSDAHFAWHRLGAHSNAALDPGAGGTTLMTLSNIALATPVVGLARAQTFTNTSDRNVKEAFAAVDGAKILAALVRMPMQSWKYRNEEKVRHIGPTAQDFRAAFGVGYDDKTIATVDADGVAMAAIQGLNQLVNEKDAEIKRQHSRIELLEQALAAIQSRLGMR